MLYALFRAFWRRSKDAGYRLSCHPIFDLLECHEISIEDDTPAIEANDTDKSFIMKVYPKQRPRRSAQDGVHLVNCFRVDESKSLVAYGNLRTNDGQQLDAYVDVQTRGMIWWEGALGSSKFLVLKLLCNSANYLSHLVAFHVNNTAWFSVEVGAE